MQFLALQQLARGAFAGIQIGHQLSQFLHGRAHILVKASSLSIWPAVPAC